MENERVDKGELEASPRKTPLQSEECSLLIDLKIIRGYLRAPCEITEESREAMLRRAEHAIAQAELSESPHQTAEELAQRFHEAYGRLAPNFGYRLREGFDVAWAEVPENNRQLMTAVCAEIQAELRDSEAPSFKCKARAANAGSPDYPQDCDWPTCGCDPYANKVIEALQESGALRDSEALPSRLDEREELIERVLFRRGLEHKLEGYTLETSIEIAEALGPIKGWCPECEVVVDRTHIKRHVGADQLEQAAERYAAKFPANRKLVTVEAFKAGWQARAKSGQLPSQHEAKEKA